MTKIMEAVYENGVLKLSAPLPLPERTAVTVTIQTVDDRERGAWMKVSEDKLTGAWDSSDDVFDELLQK